MAPGSLWRQMERAAWTDERLDDLANRVDAGFDRVDRDIRELRVEMKEGLAEVRTTIYRTNVAMFAGLLGVIATILARGA